VKDLTAMFFHTKQIHIKHISGRVYMKLVIHGKNIEITEAIREYVHQKIEKAVSHFQHITNEVDVHLSVARNPRITTKQAAEVTIYANGNVIRAEESSENLYASIDLVADKIARQLRKYKEKRQDKKTNVQPTNQVLVAENIVPDLIGDRTPELPSEVVRTKYFSMPPMTVAEAAEQLQLVGHDFYMFHNAETGEINVIYERNHGGYGVIQPRPTNVQNGNGNHAMPEKAHSHK
jgi:putative sigma-54 modulation protein